MITYASRFVHKISPKDTDTGPEVTLDTAGLDRSKLGRVLREARILIKGQRVAHYRIESDGRIVCFPMASIWWSIILTPKAGT